MQLVSRSGLLGGGSYRPVGPGRSAWPERHYSGPNAGNERASGGIDAIPGSAGMPRLLSRSGGRNRGESLPRATSP